MSRTTQILAAATILAGWSLSADAQASVLAPPADGARAAPFATAPGTAAEARAAGSATPAPLHPGSTPPPAAPPGQPARLPLGATPQVPAEPGPQTVAEAPPPRPIAAAPGSTIDSVDAARDYAEGLRETDPGSYAQLDRDVRKLESADTMGTVVTWMGLLGGGTMIAVAGVQMLTPCEYGGAMTIADIKAVDDACQDEMVTSAGLMFGGLVLSIVGPLIGGAITPGKADVRRAVRRSSARRRRPMQPGVGVTPRRDGAVATLSLRVDG